MTHLNENIDNAYEEYVVAITRGGQLWLLIVGFEKIIDC